MADKHRLDPYVWDREAEERPRASLRALQVERLVNCVEHAACGSPMWRDRLDAAGVTPRDVRSLDDVTRLPMTTKADLRAAYPFGALAVPRHRVVRALTSSGTTGHPTVAAYTVADLELWADLVARGLAAAGVGIGATVHIAYGYGLFTGGPGFQAAAERVGALVIPAGAADESRHLTLMEDFGAAALLCTPSFAATLLERAGDSARELPVSVGIFGGEPAGASLRRRLEAGWGVRIFEAYGLSEVLGPGVAQGCAEGALHLNEDHFLPEIVDPISTSPLPDGERGELVLTALTREAVPLLRYRTGDLTRIDRSLCACGRTLSRIEPVRGRVDDAIVIENRAILPLDLEDIVVGFDVLAPVFEVRRGERDILRVESGRASSPADRASLAGLVERAVADFLGVRVEVAVEMPGTLPRSRGKARRVVDDRPSHSTSETGSASSNLRARTH